MFLVTLTGTIVISCRTSCTLQSLFKDTLATAALAGLRDGYMCMADYISTSNDLQANWHKHATYVWFAVLFDHCRVWKHSHARLTLHVDCLLATCVNSIQVPTV